MTLNNVPIPIPLSSDEESTLDSNSDNQEKESPTAETEADSPCSPEEELPVSTPNAGLPYRAGGVTNRLVSCLSLLAQINS